MVGVVPLGRVHNVSLSEEWEGVRCKRVSAIRQRMTGWGSQVQGVAMVARVEGVAVDILVAPPDSVVDRVGCHVPDQEKRAGKQACTSERSAGGSNGRARTHLRCLQPIPHHTTPPPTPHHTTHSTHTHLHLLCATHASDQMARVPPSCRRVGNVHLVWRLKSRG